jgi:hypothetical protein
MNIGVIFEPPKIKLEIAEIFLEEIYVQFNGVIINLAYPLNLEIEYDQIFVFSNLEKSDSTIDTKNLKSSKISYVNTALKTTSLPMSMQRKRKL